MSGHRLHLALGVSSNILLETLFDAENPRRVSLDPSVMRPQSEANRAQMPILWLDYSDWRKMKLKFDTGAKIINLIRVLELETYAAVDEAHLSELVYSYRVIQTKSERTFRIDSGTPILWMTPFSKFEV